MHEEPIIEKDKNQELEVEANTTTNEITIGQYLREKREQKGLSLKVISQQTKIHIGLLENLEADMFNKLPSKAYVRGFVKSTSKILGLDQDYALALLENAYRAHVPPAAVEITNYDIKNDVAKNTISSIAPDSFETMKSLTANSGILLLKIGIAAIAVVIIGINVKNFFERSPEEIQPKLPEVLTTLQKRKAPTPKPVEAPVVAEPVSREEPLKINLIQDKNQKTDVVVKDVNLSTISIGEKQFAPDTTIPADQMDTLLPPKYRIQVVKGTETIFLNASEGDSWLTYKVDDKDIKKFVLRQGRTLFLRGSLIRLFIGNSKSLKIFYNNKPVVLVSNGKATSKNIVLPEELKTKYMAPLFVFKDDGSVVTSDVFVKENPPEVATPATSTTPASNPKAP